MTAIFWKTGVNGDWESPLNWSSSFVPGAGDAVTIGVAGNYTITVKVVEGAGSLNLTASGAILLLDAGLRVTSVFSETSGTVAVASGQALSVTGAAGFGVNG